MITIEIDGIPTYSTTDSLASVLADYWPTYHGETVSGSYVAGPYQMQEIAHLVCVESPTSYLVACRFCRTEIEDALTHLERIFSQAI